MSVEDKLHRLVIARDNIRTALEGQGIDASNHGFEGFAEDIGDIEKLSDVDVVAFGDNPTLPDKGKTNPANYEAIADAINAAKVRPNAVTVEPLSVTENGTYQETGKAYSPVSVSVRNVDAEDKDINFYDVDGVRLFSYTRDEFAALSALPTAPNRPDLFLNFTMWNWTKAEIDAQPGYVEVGALYDLTDCDCALVVEPTIPAQKNATLRFYTGSGNTVDLDWGDGSAVESYNASSDQVVATHTWAKIGRKYRITLKRTAGSSRITPGGAANANLLWGVYGDFVSIEPLKEIYLGSNCTTATILGSTACIDKCVFCSDAEKKTSNCCLTTAPMILSRNSNYNFAPSQYSNGLKRRVLLAGNSLLPAQQNDAFRLTINEKIMIPAGTISIGSRAFLNASNLKTIHCPASVSTISGTGFSLRETFTNPFSALWFYSVTPPTLSASNSLELPEYTILIFPFAGLADYLEETNWPGISQPSLAFATYNDGATLPTTDTTQGYNVTWYASQDDALNEQNPITTGSGKRIFCTIEEVTP